jgi:peptidoglycan-N-acetylglucosamine deacetylase
MTLIAWVTFFIVSVSLLYIPAAHVVLRMLRRAYSKGLQRYDRVICLTFDDGPDPVATPMILKVLQAHGVHATFFVLAKNAAEYPDVIAAIEGDGHEIGEHGRAHLHPWKSMPWSYFLDLASGHTTLSRLQIARKQRLFRPTYGKANALTFVFAGLFRKTFIFWNVDPHDYQRESVSDTFQSVISLVRKTRGAAVVLLHDGRTAHWKNSTTVTAAVVDLVCAELLTEGYQFRTVSGLKRNEEPLQASQEDKRIFP